MILTGEDVAPFLFGIPPGRVSVLAGLEPRELRAELDISLASASRSALFIDIMPRETADAVLASAIAGLREAVRRSWPVWYSDEDFSGIRGDTLGRVTLALRIDALHRRLPAVSTAWAKAAAVLTLGGNSPRVPEAAREVEFAQLCLVLNPHGLVLVTPMGEDEYIEPFIAALEWMARTGHVAVLALCRRLPPMNPPFDRLLFRAATVSANRVTDAGPAPPSFWIAPLGGRAHPLSEVEKRIEKLLRADAELGPLFAYNQLVETVRGGRYRVDLVWREGRLVVELDGYADHTARDKFSLDRHRDYDLMLDGYRVLRIANDEAAQDYGRAVEKIRDVVRLQK
ncbi:MAG: DUF559 domain-containing protein [Methylobacteriaceae bacterium]|nr:DUF559 domain-containing protein [Methylobacteriaceae bacterium]